MNHTSTRPPKSRLAKSRSLQPWLLFLFVSCGCQAIGGIHKAKYDPSLDDNGDGDSTTNTGDGDSTTSTGDGDGDSTTSNTGDGDGDSTTNSTGDGDGDSLEVPGVRGAFFASDTCSTDVDIKQENLESCLYRISCDPLLPSFTLSTCLTFDYLSAYSAESCSQGATSCEEITDCLGRKTATTDQQNLCSSVYGDGYTSTDGEPCSSICVGQCNGYCNGTYSETGECSGQCDGACTGLCYSFVEKSWVCDGDWAVDCAPGGTAYDCAEVSASCGEALVDSGYGDGGCQTSAPAESGVDCSLSSDESAHCSGNTYYWCSNGQAWGFDCDGACVENADGSTYCALSSDTCSATGQTTCEGGALDYCNPDGVHSVHSCAANGLNCTEDDYTYNDTDYTYVSCLASGCTSSACTERCVDGTIVEFCVGGAQIQVDCAEYGFVGCQESYDGTDYAARCTMTDPPNDNCYAALNGSCDAVGLARLCEPGTDSTDCGDTCSSARNGVCDVPAELCAVGTDNSDCGDLCSSSNDGTCDSTSVCPYGSDTTDCAAVE